MKYLIQLPIGRFKKAKIAALILSSVLLLFFQNCQGVTSQLTGTDQNNSGNNGGQNLPGDSSIWNVGALSFMQSSGSTVDLKQTRPQGVRAGGQFSLDPASASLPSGMSLSADGILYVGSAAATTVNGVIFSYNEPN